MVVHGSEPSIIRVCFDNGSPARAGLSQSPNTSKPGPGWCRMPYVFVRENMFKWWVTVEGLNLPESKHLAEKIGEQPEQLSDQEKTVEFSIPSWRVRNSKYFILQISFLQVLNGLESLGYKVNSQIII